MNARSIRRSQIQKLLVAAGSAAFAVAAYAQPTCTQQVTSVWNIEACPGGGPIDTGFCWYPGSVGPMGHGLIDGIAGPVTVGPNASAGINALTLGFAPEIAIRPNGSLSVNCLAINTGRIRVHAPSPIPELEGGGSVLQFNQPNTLVLTQDLPPYGQIFLDATSPSNPFQAIVQGAPLTIEGFVELFGSGAVSCNTTNRSVRGMYANQPGKQLIFTNGGVNEAEMGAIDGGVLVIDGGIPWTQSAGGTMAAYNASTVTIRVDVTGGFLHANDGGVVIHESGTVRDATYTSQGTGVARFAGGRIDNSVIDARSELVPAAGGLSINATNGCTITNNGSMTINPAGSSDAATFVTGYGHTNLLGTGEIILNAPSESELGDAAIFAVGGGYPELRHGAGHTIRGTGRVGPGIVLLHDGVIRADVPGRTLEVTLGSTSNNNLLEATDGRLLINQQTIDQTGGGGGGGGAIRAHPSDPFELVRGVELDYVTIRGGLMECMDGGLFKVRSRLTLSNTPRLVGRFDVAPATPVIIEQGSLVNDGMLVLNGAGQNPTYLTHAPQAPTFINGTGQIVLNAADESALESVTINANWDQLVFGAGQTVRGTGLLTRSITSNGTVLADVPGRTFHMNYGTFISNGLTAARNGGTMLFTSTTVRGNVAAENGRVVFGMSNIVENATLTASPAGVIVFDDDYPGDFGTSLGENVTLNGNCVVADDNYLRLTRSRLVNNGVLTIHDRSSPSVAGFIVGGFEATTTLDGTGRIVFNALYPNPIGESVMTVGVYNVVNGPDHTIAGRGRILDPWGYTFRNEGIIAPGMSPGLIECNAVTVFAAASRLRIELGGLTPDTEHDQLDCTKKITLGGALEVTLIDGFMPRPGDEFVIVRTLNQPPWIMVEGAFATVSTPSIAGRTFSVVYDIDRVRVVVGCSADFDGDGDTGTDADIEAFFACLGGNCCDTCGSADFDGDGDTGTDADIEAFFRVLGGGAC